MRLYYISSILLSLGLHFFVVMDFSLESQMKISPELSSKKQSFNLNLGRKKEKSSEKPLSDKEKGNKSKKNIVYKDTFSRSFNSGAKTSIAVLNKYVPDYPYRSRLLAEEGIAIVEVTIDESAKVLDSLIVKSSGFKRLDLAALEASKKSSFNIKNKSTGKVFTHKLEFNFKLKR